MHPVGTKTHVLGMIGMVGIAAVARRVGLAHAIMGVGVGVGVGGIVAVLAMFAREGLHGLLACRHRHHPRHGTHRHGVAQQAPKDQEHYQKKGRATAHGMNDSGAVR